MPSSVPGSDAQKAAINHEDYLLHTLGQKQTPELSLRGLQDTCSPTSVRNNLSIHLCSYVVKRKAEGFLLVARKPLNVAFAPHPAATHWR
jgi:hypothetical protein